VAVALGRLDAHELGVVLAEGLIGLELQVQRFARALSLERALERFQKLAITAVQIGKVGRRLKLHALGIVHLDAQGDDRVLRYDRSRLTTS
jgi:hypothetical protein